MSAFELNKVFAAVLLAAIVAVLVGFAGDIFVAPRALAKDAVTIEVADAGTGGAAAAAAPKGPEPVLGLIGAADVAKGQQIARACAACHNLTKGGANGVGPALWGVVGRNKGSAAGYAYSPDMAAKSGESWTYEDLNAFLWKPKSLVAGTKMTFAGLKKPEERAAVIAFLRSLADSPAAAPSADEIAKEQADLGAAAAPAPEAAPAPATEGAAPAEAAPAPAEAPKN